jgi:hypothetical protein
MIGSDFKIMDLFVSENFYKKNKTSLLNKTFEIISEKEIQEISISVTNISAIGVFKTKENSYIEKENNEFVLVLDEINDPGNL